MYGLGCTLYSMLTGQPPKQDLLSDRRYRWLLPAGFEPVIATALAHRPDLRYATCGALARAARDVLRSAAPAADATAAAVAEILTDTNGQLGPPFREHVRRLWTYAAGPLTMGVAGPPGVDTSTLVNALIGRQVAPTAAGHGPVATRYRWGRTRQAQVVLSDGRKRALRSSDGRLPTEFDAPSARVDRVEVELDSPSLRDLTVIDMPGSMRWDEPAPDPVPHRAALDPCDVLLWVSRAEITDGERRTVDEFSRRSGPDAHPFRVNVIGVVAAADHLDRPGDPWRAAHAAAAAHARDLGGRVVSVLPLIATIAETCESGELTETRAGWLGRVALLPPGARVEALGDAQRFSDLTGLSAEARTWLLEHIGHHGIAMITESAETGTSIDTLRDWLRDISGLTALRERIDTVFLRPTAAHKMGRVLAELEQLARDPMLAPSEREWLTDRVEAAWRSTPMHTLHELRALAALYTGTCPLPDDQYQAGLRLFSRTDPATRLGAGTSDTAELSRAARDAHKHWKRLANASGDPRITMVAETATRTTLLILTGYGAPHDRDHLRPGHRPGPHRAPPPRPGTTEGV